MKKKKISETTRIVSRSYLKCSEKLQPVLIANYTNDLVLENNSFFQTVSILGQEDLDKKIFRVQLAKKVADTISLPLQFLGIDVHQRM